MDIATIAARSKLLPRKLRYAVDHELIPAISPTREGRGQTRTFSNFEGFAIAVAAMFLDAGLPSRQVRLFMEAMGGVKKTRRHGSLWTAYKTDKSTALIFHCNSAVTITLALELLRQQFQDAG